MRGGKYEHKNVKYIEFYYMKVKFYCMKVNFCITYHNFFT